MFRNHRSIMLLMISCSLAMMANGQSVFQEYAHGKVFLSNGMTLEGTELRITMEAVTIEIQGQDQTYNLTDVVQVMVKTGKAKTYGQNCAGTCVGINLGLWLASGGTMVDEDGNSQEIKAGDQVVGILLWGGISYGIGYLIGKLVDDWEIVYYNRA